VRKEGNGFAETERIAWFGLYPLNEKRRHGFGV
jgi:hypothetical protein